MGAPIEIGRDEARERAAEELAKAKYQGIPDWLTDLLDQVNDLLQTLLNPQIGPSGGGFNWVFLVIVLAVIAALVLIVWKVGLPRWRSRVPDAEIDTDPEQLPADYRTAAERAAAAGDFSAAIRERFRALVRELEHRTIIAERPGRTALEAAGSAARMMPQVEPELHRAAILFNDVMYGELRADAPGYATISACDQAVREAAEKFRHPEEDDSTESGSATAPAQLGGVP